MAQTLVVFAHPFLEYSNSNIELINFYERSQHYDFKDLYEEYPDMHVQAFKERKQLLKYDRFVFHFPLIWFGMPPLLRLWMDEIADGNWLSGAEKNPFENKEVYILVTTRSKERSFGRLGKHGFTMEELISGFLVTLKVFNAQIKNIYVVYESETLSKKEIIKHKQQFVAILNQ